MVLVRRITTWARVGLLVTGIAVACGLWLRAADDAGQPVVPRGALRAPIAGAAESGVDIMYFVVTPTTGALAPEAMAPCVAAAAFVTGTSWSEVVSRDASNTIDVLLVDEGGLQFVDWPWASDRVARGMILAAVNVTASQLVASLADHGLTEYFEAWNDQFDSRPSSWPGPFFSIVSHYHRGSRAALTAVAVDPHYLPDPLVPGDWLSAHAAVYEDLADGDVMPPDGAFYLAGNTKFCDILESELGASRSLNTLTDLLGEGE